MRCFGFAALAVLLTTTAHAQFGPGGPPAVGVAIVAKQAVVESNTYVGRIQTTDKVDLVARVTAGLQERRFVEGTEVKQGDLLYRLERGIFEADLASKQAAIAQSTALLKNAIIILARAQSLINSPAGKISSIDDARAQEASLAATLQANQALARASQINLDYTDIRAPIAGKIGRSAYAVGNVVSPTSGPLATIVSQDPIYVVFPIAMRAALDLRNRYADQGGFAAIQIRLRLPDGKLYAELGKLDYVDPSVAAATDTLTLRARIANPIRKSARADDIANRELLDGEFVTVMVEGVTPVQALAVPRVAVLSDQQGNYVYVVDAEKKAQVRRVELGQSTPALATILSGLKEGETVIVDGLQRVRPGNPVNPVPLPPAAPPSTPGAAPAAAPKG
jgi:membrane fusion protein (multidrug efflux system)